LLEMSRQRLRAGVVASSSVTCPHCGGTGLVRSTESAALRLLRALDEEGQHQQSSNLSVKAPNEVVIYVLNQKRREIARIEEAHDLSIAFDPQSNMVGGTFEIDRTGPRLGPPRVKTAVSVEAGFAPEEPEPEEPAVEEGVEEEEETEALEQAEEAAETEREPEQQHQPQQFQQGEGGQRRRRRRRGRRGRGSRGHGEYQGQQQGQQNSGQQNSGQQNPGQPNSGQPNFNQSFSQVLEQQGESGSQDEFISSPQTSFGGQQPSYQQHQQQQQQFHQQQRYQQGEGGQQQGQGQGTGGGKRRRRRRGRRGRGRHGENFQGQNYQGGQQPSQFDQSAQTTAPNTPSAPQWSLESDARERTFEPREQKPQERREPSPAPQAEPVAGTPAEPSGPPRKGWWQRNFGG